MDFRNTNRLNALVNIFTGNLLPVTSDESNVSAFLKIYPIFTWIVVTIYVFACVCAIPLVSREKALRSSTVNLVISTEIFLVIWNMYRRRDLLRCLIANYNDLLSNDDELLREVVNSRVAPMQTFLQFYVIVDVCSVAIWTVMPLSVVLEKEEFAHEDYALPIAFARQPISKGAFVAGLLFEMTAAVYTIAKKIALDIYTIHLILLLTAQYEYLRIKLAAILGGSWQNFSTSADGEFAREEFNLFARRHCTVVRTSGMLRSVLSFNVCVVHVDSVFRFCFLSFMLATNPVVNTEGCLIVFYSIGAIVQLYIICYCVQELFEAGSKLTDKAFHEAWYSQERLMKHNFATIVLANRMECNLCLIKHANLTLPAFVQILNQAYSVCLLFLKVK